MTAGAAVRWGAARLARAGVPEPRREARLLLRAIADIDAIVYPDKEIRRSSAATYVAAIGRRSSREPFAYVAGRRYFRDVVLHVDRRVLVPRPETETVVERAALLAPPGALVADLCTGSGAIAVAVATERPDVRVDATDLSSDALVVAHRNIQQCALADRVTLWQGDLWEALPPARLGRYDLCSCNPPYVDADDFPHLEPEVREWEPRIALVAEEGWRSMYARLARGGGRWLTAGGWLVTEVGLGQADEVAATFAAHGLRDVAVHADLAGVPRVVEGRWPG